MRTRRPGPAGKSLQYGRGLFILKFMTKDYGQFCGVAKAASTLGERWALLVVRDLSIGPRRFNELHEGLPGIATSLLTTRLRELEAAGVVERRVAALPGRGITYALTGYGQGLLPALDALGRWGAQRMREPEPADVVTDSSLAAALRAAFQQQRPVETPTRFQIHVGPASAWAGISADGVEVGAGTSASEPDLVLRASPEFRLVLAGEVSAEEALRSGVIEVEDATWAEANLRAFTEAFQLPLDDRQPRQG